MNGDSLQAGNLAGFVGQTILRKLTWRDVIEKTNDGYRLASPILGKRVRERAL